MSKEKELKNKIEEAKNKIAEYKKLQESSNFNIRTLLEAELEQAEIILAAKDFASKLQKMAEDLANMQAEALPLVDQMKETFGPEIAQGFETAVTKALQDGMASVRSSKDEVTNSIMRLEGKEVPEIGNDMAAPLGGSDDVTSLDDAGLEGGEESDDMFGAADAVAGPEDEPLGRAKKESFKMVGKRLLESESIESLMSWLFEDVADTMPADQFGKFAASIASRAAQDREVVAGWIAKRRDSGANAQMADPFAGTDSSVLDESSIPSGLKGWVKDYKEMIKHGNKKGASEIKTNIDREITKLGLNKKKVYESFNGEVTEASSNKIGDSSEVNFTPNTEFKSLAESVKTIIDGNIETYGKGKAFEAINTLLSSTLNESENGVVNDVYASKSPAMLRNIIDLANMEFGLDSSWKAPRTNESEELVSHIDSMCKEFGLQPNEKGKLVKKPTRESICQEFYEAYGMTPQEYSIKEALNSNDKKNIAAGTAKIATAMTMDKNLANKDINSALGKVSPTERASMQRAVNDAKSTGQQVKNVGDMLSSFANDGDDKNKPNSPNNSVHEDVGSASISQIESIMKSFVLDVYKTVKADPKIKFEELTKDSDPTRKQILDLLKNDNPDIIGKLTNTSFAQDFLNVITGAYKVGKYKDINDPRSADYLKDLVGKVLEDFKSSLVTETIDEAEDNDTLTLIIDNLVDQGYGLGADAASNGDLDQNQYKDVLKQAIDDVTEYLKANKGVINPYLPAKVKTVLTLAIRYAYNEQVKDFHSLKVAIGELKKLEHSRNDESISEATGSNRVDVMIHNYVEEIIERIKEDEELEFSSLNFLAKQARNNILKALVQDRGDEFVQNLLNGEFDTHFKQLVRTAFDIGVSTRQGNTTDKNKEQLLYDIRSWIDDDINAASGNDVFEGELTRPALQGTISGPPKEDMTYIEAKKYLDKFPEGALMHNTFERDAFVFKKADGSYGFFDDHRKPAVDTWNWDTDIKNLLDVLDIKGEPEILTDWWYDPIEDFSMHKGGTELLKGLIDGTITENSKFTNKIKNQEVKVKDQDKKWSKKLTDKKATK